MGMLNCCLECHEKQVQIDRLKEQVKSLKAKLKLRERKESEGFFGSQTSSAKKPVKANTVSRKAKTRGAKKNHKGTGRQAVSPEQAEQIVDIQPAEEMCPDCLAKLKELKSLNRSVIESRPIKAQKILYRLGKKKCPKCKQFFKSQAPSVLPKSLYGNQLIANSAVMHYLHGIPMGRICEQIGIGPGSLVGIFHRLGRLFSNVPKHLIEEYRQSEVKHADETGWRTNGKNGYAWLFATEDLSIFQFKTTRSSSVPRAVFGEQKLPGVLVVDRYNGYNKMPCDIQYCYSHLLREVQDVQKEFSDNQEVLVFVSTVAPLLSQAMGLRNQKISDKQFAPKALKVKEQIEHAMEQDAMHLGIRRIQDIFTDNKTRLYHWAQNRHVPAENNLAERDLRPTVIARKTSFGSQSDAGAQTRSVLMSVLNTLKKRGRDVVGHLKCVLDSLAKDMNQDPIHLLFPEHPPTGPI